MKGTAAQSCGPDGRKGFRTGGKRLRKKKKGGFFRGLLKVIGTLLLAVIIFVAGFFGFLSITEFRPEDTEALKLEGSPDEGLIPAGETVRIISWNLGFGALGDNADFFMDGGTMVRPSDEKRVISNLEKLVNGTQTETPDIVFLQEIDRDSRRSYHIDQLTYFRSALQGYTSTFATNFKVAFLPYPVPPIGKVDSGIAVFSRYAIDSAERVKLPSPFKWPVRMANLKRCLLVSRMTVEGSGKELVLINLHLEAYDDGDGKIAQTKMLKELMEAEREKGNYVIVGGDFNQLFSSVDNGLFPQQGDLWQSGDIDVTEFDPSWQFFQDEKTPSCRSLDKPYAGADHSTFQYYQIDGFIVSGNIAVSRFEVIPHDFVCSDHDPVVMEFTLQ